MQIKTKADAEEKNNDCDNNPFNYNTQHRKLPYDIISKVINVLFFLALFLKLFEYEYYVHTYFSFDVLKKH